MFKYKLHNGRSIIIYYLYEDRRQGTLKTKNRSSIGMRMWYVCLSVMPSVSLWRCSLWLNDPAAKVSKQVDRKCRSALLGTRQYNTTTFHPTRTDPPKLQKFPMQYKEECIRYVAYIVLTWRTYALLLGYLILFISFSDECIYMYILFLPRDAL